MPRVPLMLVTSIYITVPGEDPSATKVWVSPGFGFILVWLSSLDETGRGKDEPWFPVYRELGSRSAPHHPEKHLRWRAAQMSYSTKTSRHVIINIIMARSAAQQIWANPLKTLLKKTRINLNLKSKADAWHDWPWRQYCTEWSLVHFIHWGFLKFLTDKARFYLVLIQKTSC